MSNGDLLYVCGGALAVSAVLLSFIGLRVESFPGRFAPLVALWFVALVGASTTFAVMHAQDEEKAKAAELTEADEEAEKAESGAPVEPEGEESPKPASGSKGAATTLQLSASPTSVAFDTTKLNARAGEVTIDFTNPSALEHDVAIEQDGKQIAISERITKGKTSVSAELEPGAYTFLCTVPGHAEAGMQGTLTIE